MLVRSGETVSIELVFSAVAGSYSLFADSGQVVGVDPHRWQWTAPCAPGCYRLVLTDTELSDPVVIEARVIDPTAVDRAAPQLLLPAAWA